MGQNPKNDWNRFMEQNQAGLLQSWQWGEFQELLGRKIWRIGANQLRGLLVEFPLPFKKNYLYCPRGPIGRFSQAGFLDFVSQVRQIAKQSQSIFLKIEPEADCRLPVSDFQLSQKQIQPRQTIILDLKKTEEELLSQMRQKTRYNLRLAVRKGVEVEFSSQPSLLEEFITLQKQTAHRDNFRLYPDDYYRQLFKILSSEKMAELVLAKYQGRIIAVNFSAYFNQTAYYLYGASDYRYRQLMAPYLLQWQAIKRAKKAGYQFYDFWGIDEDKWPGVTRFKRGFAGRELVYPGSYDLVFNRPWYGLYNLTRKIKGLF